MKALKEARAKVNAEKFGTDAWESAMQAVRDLCEKADSKKDHGKHKSVDGDVWSV